MAYPVYIFDGGDGAGKTTQSLLLSYFLKQEYNVPVTYFSFPVYEFPIGQVIGRCLGRWGEKEKIDLASPEDMALLFSLNRLEALPYLMRLIKQGYLPICNRGPYANLFSVARRAIKDGVEWKNFSREEKTTRVNRVLGLDEEFISTIREEREIVNLFLFLDPKESMELARRKALSTLNAEPDEHERDFELQELAVSIYKEITEGEISGHQAEFVQATRGSFRRWREERGEDFVELDGVLNTAKEVSRAFCSYLDRKDDSFYRLYAMEISLSGNDIWRLSQEERSVNFEFREILGLREGQYPNLNETRPELMAEIKRSKPGVWAAIESSRRLDEELARSKEGAIFSPAHGKERL